MLSLKFNYSTGNKYAFIDIETRSLENINSTARYCSPRACLDLLCVGFSVDGKFYCAVPKHVIGGLHIPDVELVTFGDMSKILRGRVLVGHNCEAFDAPVLASLGYLQDFEWFDTIHIARSLGIPASLASLAERFNVGQIKGTKDAWKSFNNYRKRTGWVAGNSETWTALVSYNRIDVQLLEKVFYQLAPSARREELATHSKINQYGVKIDTDYVAALQRLQIAFKAECAAEFEELTELESGKARSTKSVKDWLAKNGLTLSSLDQDEVKVSLSQRADVNPKVLRVLELRNSLNTSSFSKLDLVPHLVDSEGIARGLIVPYKAHTGRFAGRELQPHNLPKGDARVRVENLTLEACKAESTRLGIPLRSVLASLLRGIFVSRTGLLGCFDYAQMELRTLAWFVEESRSLALIAKEDSSKDSDSDLYCDTASTIFGHKVTKKDDKKRQAGKIIELGCGYGMGAGRFNDFAKSLGVDLKEVGLDPVRCISVYRDSHPNIVNCWRAFQAIIDSNFTNTVNVCKVSCTYETINNVKNLTVTLPSGRRLTYRNIEKVEGSWRFDGEFCQRRIYGALVVENIIQAICCDMLWAALQNCNNYNVVLHVHDELLLEMSHVSQLRPMLECVCNLPGWCKGYPVKAEGRAMTRYSKSNQYTVATDVWSKKV